MQEALFSKALRKLGMLNVPYARRRDDNGIDQFHHLPVSQSCGGKSWTLPPMPTVALLELALVSSVFLLKLEIPRKPHRQSSTDLWASCRGRIWGFRVSAADFVHFIL